MRGVRALSDMGHRNTPLVVRASLPRTFWSVGLFAVTGLCFLGFYLLIGVLKNPTDGEQTEVLVAGVLLALASILLFYLIGPKHSEALARHERRKVKEEMWIDLPLTGYGEALQARKRAEKEMAKQGLPGPM
jgi:hypothetical protein